MIVSEFFSRAGRMDSFLHEDFRKNPVSYQVLVVREQTNGGLDPSYINARFQHVQIDSKYPYIPCHKISWSGFPERMSELDFGQANCMRLLREAVDLKCNNAAPIVLYASGCGAATALNWITDDSIDMEVRRQVRLVVLESPVVSGNTTLWHAASSVFLGHYLKSAVRWLRLDTVVPIVLSLLFYRSYRTHFRQPLQNAENFPRHVPVVIVHSRYNRQTSYNDACALYYVLKQKLQHPHAYLCTREDEQQFNLFSSVDGVVPSPYPRMSHVVSATLCSNLHLLPQLFALIATESGSSNEHLTIDVTKQNARQIRDEAQHPVDGLVTYEQCYDNVIDFDNRVRRSRYVLAGIATLIIFTMFVVPLLGFLL